MKLEIRHLQYPSQFETCVDLQKTVWGFEDRDVVPARMMIIAQKRGGLVMGAFDKERIIGFVFAIPSLHNNRFAQHSHMLAVLQQYRDQGVGRQLKLAQYQDAKKRNVPVITWTFDPLETKNAYLNLNRLGAVSNTYYVNLYGERTSSDLHSGLGTDRFLVEWFIGAETTEKVLGGFDPTPDIKGLQQVLCWRSGDRFDPGEPRLHCSAAILLAEAPPDTQRLKKLSLESARQWRDATRTVFQHYFDRGYRIKALARCNEVLPLADYGLPRAFYVLERHED
jgi:predicted GNAT superfamily acetyltransferase